jgi:hypothetical protein
MTELISVYERFAVVTINVLSETACLLSQMSTFVTEETDSNLLCCVCHKSEFEFVFGMLTNMGTSRQ